MEINSLEYLLFAALACGGYFIAPKKIKWSVLLLVSYIYYLICNGTLAVFLMITTLSIYLLGLGINKIDEKTKAQCKKVEKEAVQEASQGFFAKDPDDDLPFEQPSTITAFYKVIATPEELEQVEMAFNSIGIFFERRDA